MVVIREAAALLIFHQLLSTQLALAGISCSTDDDCKSKLELLTPGVSVCEEGECTNPFEQGCLKAMGEVYGKKNIRIPAAFEQVRICNSDDDVIPGNKDWCRQPTWAEVLTYDEVRMTPSNWESAIFNSWIYQILLTELLEVPATLENGDGKRGAGSFYDRNRNFVYTTSAFEKTIHTTLWEADRLDGDCSKSEVPCAHIMPEIWDAGLIRPTIHGDGRILPPSSNGMIARTGFYIPSITAANHPELSSSFYGLTGEKNRRNLAEKFLTPTTWKDYCAEFSNPLNCTSNDGVATRAPVTEKEQMKYFAAGLFKGHFRKTPESDCDANPSCTGHFVNKGCAWETYGEAQMFWNNISLSSRGTKDNNNGYSSGQMVDIWKAANATKSNVLMWYWFPDPTLEKFQDSDFSFVRVDWKRTSAKCLRWRLENIDACSSNLEGRLGSGPMGSCDQPIEKPVKYFSRSLKTMHENKPEALRSPTYPFMKQVEVSPYALDEMFKHWVKIDMDYSGIDAREATCKWVYDNLEDLQSFIPSGYPRKVNENRNIVYIYVAYCFAATAVLLVVLVAIFVYKLRERRAMKLAQVEFLIWIIIGLGLVSIGAIIGADATSDVACVAAHWSVLIGYTLEIAPILIKVQAINRAISDSLSFRNIKIDVKKLKKYPFFFVTPVILYLIVWTVVDMSEPTNTFILDKTGTGDIIEMSKTCASRSTVWPIVAYLWQALLLLSASVLAFQSRNDLDEMNESQWIGFLVYSHFMFLIFRIVIKALSLAGVISGSLATSIMCIILSLDVLAALVIYFGPKFYKIATEGSSNNVFMNGLGSGGGAENSDEGTGGMSTISRLRKAGINVIQKPHADGSINAPIGKDGSSIIQKLSDHGSRRKSAESGIYNDSGLPNPNRRISFADLRTSDH